jgi:pimeloyl-ACP methyl ester carboxylesterase
LLRPDVFRSVAMMSAPFAGPPALPSGTDMDAQLAALEPPRKYYMRYFCMREANANMLNAPQGLHSFLRAYYHYKSADWKLNKPFPLEARTAAELAKMPTYYVMDRDSGMAETVAREMPAAAEVVACQWLTEDELHVYRTEYCRTGFQGGLQAYRCIYDPELAAELGLFSDRTVEVPSCFIAGSSDWGVYQTPGAAEKMRGRVCTRMTGFHLVNGAGHWVQQEQAEKVSALLIQFLQDQTRRRPNHAPA